MPRLVRDLSYALRSLGARPGVGAAIVLTLALGIGANTAVFSVVNAVLLKPLPYQDGDRLVWLWSTDPGNPTAEWVSYADFADIRSQSRAFEGLASWFGYEMVLTGDHEPQRLQVLVTFGDLFSVLGVPPELGTTYRSERDGPHERAIVLSHRFWAERFGADPQLVGRSVTLSGNSYRVAGVMPRGFQFPIQTPAVDLWATLGSEQYAEDPQLQRNARGLEAIGRLRADVDLASAQAELDVIASRLSRQYPGTNTGVGARIVPAADKVVGRISRPLLVLFAAVGFVLLIACVNVANLLLARAADRRREISVRAALGASRARIAAQLVAESLMLAVAGGGLGALLATAGVEALVAMVPRDLPRANEIAVDGSVLAFTLLASVATGLLFGVAPAWHASKADLTTALQDGGRTAVDGRRAVRLRSALVVAEMALAVVLLMGSALFLATLWTLTRPAEGLDARNVLTFEVTWPWEKYSRERAGDQFRLLQAAMRAVPGVRGAAAGLQLPDRGGPFTDAVFPYLEIEGRPLPGTTRPRVPVIENQPGYFSTLGIGVVAGRDFDDHDGLKTTPVAVVNESFARTYFGSENPIGKRVALEQWLLFGDQKPLREIVGVVADVKHAGLAAARPLVYIPLAQRPFNTSYVVVKTAGPPASFVNAIREAVHSVDKDQPIFDVRTLEERIGMSVAQERFNASLLTIFAGLAVLLAAVGLYGVLSYHVAQRTHEMGVRLALGAGRRDVLALVMRHGLTLIAGGLAIGVAGALALTSLVDGLLFGVSASDPLMQLTVIGVLTDVAVAACWLPARRAAHVDPIVALRYE
jgi:putative ABC transport system permease protein